MSRRQGALSFGSVLLALLVLAGVTPAVAAEIDEIGEVFFEYPDATGVLDPSARGVVSGSIVRASSSAAVVHLDNGGVLKLDANSAVIFAVSADDEVSVTVLSGRVSKVGAHGRVLQAGSGSTFRLEPSLENGLAMEAILLQAEPRQR